MRSISATSMPAWAQAMARLVPIKPPPTTASSTRRVLLFEIDAMRAKMRVETPHVQRSPEKPPVCCVAGDFVQRNIGPVNF